MGIPTLISTQTASNDSALAFTSGIDSTYDEYMFVFTDIAPADDNSSIQFQANASAQSGYNETVTSTWWQARHSEGDDTDLYYDGAYDQAQGTGYPFLVLGTGNGADESCAGILQLFSPSNTTYVTHFYSRFSNYNSSDQAMDTFTAGYFNVTAAITEINFKCALGNFDGVIQLYGIS